MTFPTGGGRGESALGICAWSSAFLKAEVRTHFAARPPDKPAGKGAATGHHVGVRHITHQLPPTQLVPIIRVLCSSPNNRGAGSDLIFGEDGDDILYANPHILFHDTLNGGSGQDRYQADSDDILIDVEIRLLA